MTVAEVITIGIAFVALIVSVWSLILQYMPVGARLELLNAADVQKRAVRLHKDLPEHIQKAYPDIPDKMPGHALIKLVFGNAGDRTGIANIKIMKVAAKDAPQLTVKASHPDYVLIPAREIVETEVLLRNMLIEQFYELPIEIELKIKYGGYDPRTGKSLPENTIEKTIQVLIVRGDEETWLMS